MFERFETFLRSAWRLGTAWRFAAEPTMQHQPFIQTSGLQLTTLQGDLATSSSSSNPHLAVMVIIVRKTTNLISFS